MINFLCVSVNFGDYLNETLKQNASIFDKITVVTSTTDHHTQNVCRQYSNIKTIETDIFFDNKCDFNKGAGLNEGLKHIQDKDWLLIGDADCIYPSNLKSTIQELNLDKNNIYGMRRHIVHSSNELKDIIEGRVKPNPRLERAMHYTPGYFQLINLSADHIINRQLEYPQFPNAARVDRWFAKFNFGPNNRKIIDGSFVIHLGPTMINWSGRKSKTWE